MQERMERYRSNEHHPHKGSTVIRLLQSKNDADKVVARCLHYDNLIVMLLRLSNRRRDTVINLIIWLLVGALAWIGLKTLFASRARRDRMRKFAAYVLLVPE